MILVYLASLAYAAVSFEYNRLYRTERHFHQFVITFGVLFFVISVLPGAFISTHLVTVQGLLGRYFYAGDRYLHQIGWKTLRIPVGKAANLSAAYYSRGSSKWILLLPALDRSFTNYVNFLRSLSDDLQANVLAFDYRGVGHSRGEVKRANDLIADGTAVLKTLLETFQTPTDRVVLYGHNEGGIVAAALDCPHSLLIIDRSYARFSGMVTESTSSYSLFMCFVGMLAYNSGYNAFHHRRRVENIQEVEDLDGMLIAAVALTLVQIAARLFGSFVPYVIGLTVVYISSWAGQKDYVLISQYPQHWWIARVFLPLFSIYILKVLFRKTLLDILLIPVLATLAVVGIDADRWYMWMENKVFWAFLFVYLFQVSDIASTMIIAYEFEMDLVKSMKFLVNEMLLGNALVLYHAEQTKWSSSAIVQLNRTGLLNETSVHTLEVNMGNDDSTRTLLHLDYYAYQEFIEMVAKLLV